VDYQTFHSLLVVGLGYAFAGSLATGYQFLTAQPASFELLTGAARADVVLTVPFLVFAAPFIIMRNTLRACQLEGRGFLPAATATVLASFWSLASGSIVVMALQAVGVLQV
jgi:hypothetical protein